MARLIGSRRILITGLSSPIGGRVAQALEREADVEAIIGVDTTDPRHELTRTEFVRVETDHRLLARILRAAAIDTVLDTRLIADPLLRIAGAAREVNLRGTANVLAACAEEASPVRKLVFKSSAHYYGWAAGAPAFLSEEMARTTRARTAIEREIAEAETAVLELAARRRQTTVTVLRVAEELGGEGRGSHLALLNLPIVPCVLGFDPRWQFVHADDVVGSMVHAARHDLPGVYNVAADGVLTLSEVASLLGKRLLPVLPPWGTAFAAGQLRRLGLPVPVELLAQLRYGRGLDNRRLKSTGFAYRYTTREAILKLRAQQRLRPLLGSGAQPYRYEREVEEFLRWSPSVRTAPAPQPAQSSAPDGYDELSAAEVIEIIPSLETDALAMLERHERAHQAREPVLDALERTLARKRSFGGAERQTS